MNSKEMVANGNYTFVVNNRGWKDILIYNAGGLQFHFPLGRQKMGSASLHCEISVCAESPSK